METLSSIGNSKRSSNYFCSSYALLLRNMSLYSRWLFMCLSRVFYMEEIIGSMKKSDNYIFPLCYIGMIMYTCIRSECNRREISVEKKLRDIFQVSLRCDWTMAIRNFIGLCMWRLFWIYIRVMSINSRVFEEILRLESHYARYYLKMSFGEILNQKLRSYVGKWLKWFIYTIYHIGAGIIRYKNVSVKLLLWLYWETYRGITLLVRHFVH